MRRNYSLFRIALVFVTGCAFLLPVSAPAPTVDITITQFYLGFSQSVGDPNIRGPAALNIPSQTSDGDFQGFTTILGNTYSITGKVDNNGNLKFTSRTGLTGTGKWQDLTRGGALIFGTYKLASGDQGKVNFLRKFQQPPEPDTPPDIAGSWGGTFESSLSLMRGTAELTIQQDRTTTGAPGTGFTGQQTVEGGTPAVVLYDFAGTVDAQGNFVRIGNSVRGMLIDGGRVQPGRDQAIEMRANAIFHFFDGGNDDVVFVMTRID
jgi:hypothetical protein